MDELTSVKELDRVLAENNYQGTEPWAPGSRIVVFYIGKLLPGTFIGYSACTVNGQAVNNICKKCCGAVQLKLDPPHERVAFISNCWIATWDHAHRRIFLADDPIVTTIQVHFNY